jgi:hypothetical protein
MQVFRQTADARAVDASSPTRRLAATGFAVAALAVATVAATLWPATPASAEEVDLELVLAVDVSFSMDEDEQRLQRLGYVEAIRSAEVLAAIQDGIHGKIAVAYMEWAGAAEQRVVVDWQVISDAASAEAFTARLAQQPIRRVFRTSISEALAVATDLIAENGYEGIRKVIDVSGDGPNNQGRLVVAARDRAIAAGITINGLPLMLKRSANSYFDLPNLDEYYTTCVIGGGGAFLVPVRDIEAFGEAVRRKLVLEIAGGPPERATVVPAQLTTTVDPFCTIGERIWRSRIGDN